MRHHNFLSRKLANILNNNNNDLKQHFKPIIIQPKLKVKDKSLVNFNSYNIYVYVAAIHFILKKLVEVLKFDTINICQK